MAVFPLRFQSTLSMRRATRPQWALWGVRDISIHALHEESDWYESADTNGKGISIHALHEESDDNLAKDENADIISIHALHEESDSLCSFLFVDGRNFNPRSP